MRVGWWVVPGERDAVMTWIESHPPLGSHPTWVGSTFSSEPGASEAKTAGFSWPQVPGVLRSRSLEVAAVDRPGGASEVVAAIDVEWTIPRPATERIPSGAHVLEVEASGRGGRLSQTRTITKAAAVRRIAALIDGLPVRQPQRKPCPRARLAPPRMRLVFRSSRNGRALAEAVQAKRPEYCHPMTLSIGGRVQLPLEGGRVVLRGLKAMLPS